MELKKISEIFEYMYQNNIFCKFENEKAEEVAYIVLGAYLKNNDIDKLNNLLKAIYNFREDMDLMAILKSLIHLFSLEVVRKSLIGGCYANKR